MDLPMQKYSCDKCNYSTDYQSNYLKHCRTRKHSVNIGKIKEERHSCPCGKSFTRKYNLQQHTKRCENMETNEKLVKRMKQMERCIKRLEKEKTTNVNSKYYINGDNNKISVKKYIQLYFPNAPALTPLNEYELGEADLEQIAYNYKNNSIDKYLGDIIVGNYKKENPKDQSLWTSDASRLTFLVCKMLSNKQTVWVKDANGLFIQAMILNEMLNIINISAKNYLENNEMIHNFGTENFFKIQYMCDNLGHLQKEIKNGYMATKVLKYMAPKFMLPIDELKNNEDE